MVDYSKLHIKGLAFTGPDATLNEFATDGGETNAIGDYSGGPVAFAYKPEPGEKVLVHRFIAVVQSVGVLSDTKYGTNITLINGIRVGFRNDTVTIRDLTKDRRVWTNRDWCIYCHRIREGTNHQAAHWDFTMHGPPVLLDGDRDNERLELTMHDNFTTLQQHRFLVQGVRV